MKNQYLLIFIFSFFLSIVCSAKEEEVILKTSSGNIHGSLSLPKKVKGIPVVLIISGSGPTDRDGNNTMMKNNSLKFVADELSKNKIASLRFDKRGIGKSKEAAIEEKDLRFDHLVNDVKGWIKFLADDNRFSKIIVAGHSEGSLLGMIASVDNPSVNGYISIAGAGRSADIILKEQLSKTPEPDRTKLYEYLDKLKKGDTIANVPQQYGMLFRESIQPYLISWFKYNPQEEIKKLKIPVLIVQGTTDIQVPVKDAELLSEANTSATLKIIQNMNHVLKEVTSTEQSAQMKTYSNPEIKLHKELMPAMIGFVNGIK